MTSYEQHSTTTGVPRYPDVQECAQAYQELALLLAPVFFRIDVGEVNRAVAVDDIHISFR